MDKIKLLKPNYFNTESLVDKDDLKLNLNNNMSLYSINQNYNQRKKFNSTFKSFFSFSPPIISHFEKNEKALVFWVRKNSYFVLGKLDFENFNNTFKNVSSITDQTGGWVYFNLRGKLTKFLFERLLSEDLDRFTSNRVIRTSINKINCFVFCNVQFLNYKIICPISFCQNMKLRLISLTKLIE